VRQVGEGDNGMKAVASVVMNRVNVSEGEYARVSQGRKYTKYYLSARSI